MHQSSVCAGQWPPLSLRPSIPQWPPLSLRPSIPQWLCFRWQAARDGASTHWSASSSCSALGRPTGPRCVPSSCVSLLPPPHPSPPLPPLPPPLPSQTLHPLQVTLHPGDALVWFPGWEHETGIETGLSISLSLHFTSPPHSRYINTFADLLSNHVSNSCHWGHYE